MHREPRYKLAWRGKATRDTRRLSKQEIKAAARLESSVSTGDKTMIAIQKMVIDIYSARPRRSGWVDISNNAGVSLRKP